MINISTHTTSLELSKHLKELGFKQESLFYWVSEKESDGSYFLVYGAGYDWDSYPAYESYEYKISAFTASELGELLPKARVGFSDGMNGEIYEDDSDTECFELVANFSHVNKEWLVYYEGFDFGIRLDKTCESKNLVEALAKMLIYLIEKSLITL